MLKKMGNVLNKPSSLARSWRTAHERVRMYLGLALLGLLSFLFSFLALIMLLVLPRTLGQRVGRLQIAWLLRVYLYMLSLMGACRFDLTALDALRQAPAMIIAPNHPSLLDALMIFSRLPETTCVMKADIVNSIFFGASARLAGYIRNTPLRTMVQLAVTDLHQGRHLLLFPEGTRSTRSPIGPLQGTTGLIAKHAGVAVQTVFIETDSGFLGKGWSMLWTPKLPITYRIRLGKRFEPPLHTAHFASELEQYFLSELAHAELPDFPVSEPPA